MEYLDGEFLLGFCGWGEMGYLDGILKDGYWM
jgi:hypothetical protein